MKASYDLITNFEFFEIVQVPREENSHANALANLGLASGTIMKRVIPFAFLEKSSTKAPKLKEVVSVGVSRD